MAANCTTLLLKEHRVGSHDSLELLAILADVLLLVRELLAEIVVYGAFVVEESLVAWLKVKAVLEEHEEIWRIVADVRVFPARSE